MQAISMQTQWELFTIKVYVNPNKHPTRHEFPGLQVVQACGALFAMQCGSSPLSLMLLGVC